jgi:hypothetical protein
MDNVRVAVNLHFKQRIIAMSVRRVLERLRESALAQRLGIRVAPATKPKTVQAVVIHSESMTGASPEAKPVVRIIAGPKQTWIKNM